MAINPTGDRLASGGGGVIRAGCGFTYVQGGAAVLLAVGAARTPVRPSHRDPFRGGFAGGGVDRVAVVVGAPVVLLVRVGRLLVASLDRHVERAGRGFVLAVAGAGRRARKSQLADGSRQQSRDDFAVGADRANARAVSAELDGLSRCAASGGQKL